MQHRATVSFLLTGNEASYFCGGWHADVGTAKNDVAERVLWYARTVGQLVFASSENARRL